MRSISYRGTVIGGPNSPYQIISVEGLDDFDSDTTAVGVNRVHGGYVAGGYAAARELNVTFRVKDRAATTTERVRQLKAAYSPSGATEYKATVTFLDGTQAVGQARCAARAIPMGIETLVHREGSVRLMFADPRLYSPLEYGATFDLAAASAGQPWSTWDWGDDWAGADAAEREVAVINNGTFDTWPRFEIYNDSGVMTSPKIYNLDTGDVLDFSANGGLSLPVSQKLLVDTSPFTRSVASAGASVWQYLKLGSRFFSLVPGTNRLRLQSSGVATGATMIVSWRHAEL